MSAMQTHLSHFLFVHRAVVPNSSPRSGVPGGKDYPVAPLLADSTIVKPGSLSHGLGTRKISFIA
jgi:hypothetical protein